MPNADNGTVDINWQVEEKSSDQLELSAGFGGGIGLTGTLGVTFNNFSLKNITKKSSWSPLPAGDAQRLKAFVCNLTVAHTGRIISHLPNPGSVGRRGILSINYFNTKFSNAIDVNGSYCRSCGDTSYLKTVGFGISLGKQLKWPDDYFTLIYSPTSPNIN